MTNTNRISVRTMATMVVVYGYIQTRCLMIVTRQHVHGGDSQNTDLRILKTPVNSTCCHEISRRTLLEMPTPADCSSGTSVRRIELDRTHPSRRLHVRFRYGPGEPQTQKPQAGGFPAGLHEAPQPGTMVSVSPSIFSESRVVWKHLCHAEHCSCRCIIISRATVANEFVARRRH